MDLKQSARDLAIEYLLQEIKKGNLKAGDKLLNERKLSENLGISRVPLREAICTLSTLGILEAHQGDGTYVSDSYSEIFSNIIKKYGIFDRSMVDEVFEARSLFEADAARLAARNHTEDDLVKLEQALNKHEIALTDYYEGKLKDKELKDKDMMELDTEIHLGIAASSHNNFILEIVKSIRYVTLQQDYFSEQYTLDHEHFKRSSIMHREIFNAIKEKNEDLAYKKMQEHINEIRLALDIESIRRDIK